MAWRSFWRRSGTKRAKNGRDGPPIVVVGRIDVVGVVEVETAVFGKGGQQKCREEVA